MKKFNIRIILLGIFGIAAICLIIGIISRSTNRLVPLPTPEISSTTTRYVPPVTTVDDGFDTEFFMKQKYRGDCKALTGKVLLNFFLVSDGDCKWTEEDIETFKKATDDALYLMNYDAQRYDIELEIIRNYIPISWHEQIPRDNVRYVLPDLLKTVGYEDKNGVSPALASQFGTDSAALFFCFNREERSFCIPNSNENGFEPAVLYGFDQDFRHELYHLYGARDLYTPERIDKIALRFFPDSVMRVGDRGMVVDPLTAFLMGWTEHLNDAAKEFLEAVEQ